MCKRRSIEWKETKRQLQQMPFKGTKTFRKLQNKEGRNNTGPDRQPLVIGQLVTQENQNHDKYPPLNLPG